MPFRWFRPTTVAYLAAGLAAAVATSTVAGQRARPGTPARDAPAQTDAVPAPTGSIVGRVVIADSGKPLRRARVVARAAELPEGRATLTDDAGAFELPELPAGRYTLTAGRTGFITLAFGQRRPLQPGTPLQLRDGERLGPLEFRLPRGSVVAGRIVDDTGEPVPGALVRVLRYDTTQAPPQLVPAGTAQTDDKGQYRVWGLNPGDYYVAAQARGGPAFGGGGGGIGFGGPGGGIGFGGPGLGRGFGGPRGGPPAAPSGGRGGGARPGPPDAGAQSGREDPESFNYAPTYFPGVAQVAEARPVSLGVGTESADIDFPLLLIRTARVAGQVTNADGSPATGGALALSVEGQAGRGGQTYGSRISWDGSFVLASIPPGRYLLRARTDDTDGPQFAVQPLSVAGDMADLAVVLSQGGSVTGTVSVRPTQSALLPDLTQFRVTAPAVDTPAPGPQPSARPGTDGRFTLDGVPPGRHWLRAQAPRGWALASALLDGREVIDLPLDIESGRSLKGVSLVFTDRLSELNGTIADEQGTPLTEYTAVAFPINTEHWRADSRYIATARPDQNGHFQIRGLPPGEYFLSAIDPVNQGDWFDPSFLERERARAERVAIGDGDVRTKDLRVSTR